MNKATAEYFIVGWKKKGYCRKSREASISSRNQQTKLRLRLMPNRLCRIALNALNGATWKIWLNSGRRNVEYEFVTLTYLGRLYGVSSHKVGKWLKGLGLRTDAGQPSERAFQQGLVERWESTQPGTYFYAWHQSKVTKLLADMEYKRV
jgi:hypothetical protein